MGVLSALGAHAYQQSGLYKGKQALEQSKRLTAQSGQIREELQKNPPTGGNLEVAQARLASEEDALETATSAAKKAEEAVGYLGDTKSSKALEAANKARKEAKTGTYVQSNVVERTRSEMENPKTESSTSSIESSTPTVTPEQAMDKTAQTAVRQIRQRTNFAKLLEGVKHPYNGGEAYFEELPKEVQKGVVKSLTPADKKQLKATEQVLQGAKGETVSFGGEEIGTVGNLPRKYQVQIAKKLQGGK